MREMNIILPTHDNDGISLDRVHEQLRKTLCIMFGGFTSFPCFGGWMNEKTGKIIQEVSTFYSIATDRGDGITELRQLAVWVGKEARQEAVYIKHVNGIVEIVDTTSTVDLPVPPKDPVPA